MRVVALVLLLSGCSALSSMVPLTGGTPPLDVTAQVGAENTNTDAVVNKSDDKRIETDTVTGDMSVIRNDSEAIADLSTDERVVTETVTGGMDIRRATRMSSNTVDAVSGGMVVQEYTVPWWAMVLAVFAGIFVESTTIVNFLRGIRDVFLGR